MCHHLREPLKGVRVALRFRVLTGREPGLGVLQFETQIACDGSGDIGKREIWLSDNGQVYARFKYSKTLADILGETWQMTWNRCNEIADIVSAPN